MSGASSLSVNGALLLPALTPPPGVTPNFTNPERQSSGFIVAGAILLAIMVVFLCCRIYTKYYIRHKATWDDCE